MFLYCLRDYIKLIATRTAWELIVQPISTNTVYYCSILKIPCSLTSSCRLNRWIIPTLPQEGASLCLKNSLRAYAVIFFTKLTNNRLTAHLIYCFTRIFHAGIVLWDAAVNMQIQIVQEYANGEYGVTNFIFKKKQKHCARVLKNFNHNTSSTTCLSMIFPVQLA